MLLKFKKKCIKKQKKMGVDHSRLLLSDLMTDARTVFRNNSQLDGEQRKEFLRYIKEIDEEDEEMKRNNALFPPLQCLYNAMNYRYPPMYTHVTGLMSYIVLHNKTYNCWVWLLGEQHSRYGMCKDTPKWSTIHIMKLLQDHYTTTPYFLDVFYEEAPLEEILEMQHRRNELNVNENNQNDNEPKETITAGKTKATKESFLLEERYRRRNCLFNHHYGGEENGHNRTCPSNIRFHWVDTRSIYGGIPDREDYERWKRLVKALFCSEPNNLPFSEKLASYLFETIQTSKYFRKLKKALKKKEDEIKYIISRGLLSYSDGDIQEYASTLQRFTLVDFDNLSNEDRKKASYTFAYLTPMLQDIYAVARMHKEYITDGSQPEFTKNCIFYGGDHHVQSMVHMLIAMNYKPLEWSVSRHLDNEMCVVLGQDLHQPLFHRFELEDETESKSNG